MALILDGTNGLTYTGDTASSVNLSVPQSVGIGTSSPTVKLDVTGTTNIRHTYTGATGGVLFGQYNTTVTFKYKINLLQV